MAGITTQQVMWLAGDYNKSKDPDDLLELLNLIEEYFKPLPDHTCWTCGKTDTENEEIYGGSLSDIQVNVRPGEEGFSHVTRYFCDEHIEEIGNKLVELGFGSHHHGSTTFVEAECEHGYENRHLCEPPYDEETGEG